MSRAAEGFTGLLAGKRIIVTAGATGIGRGFVLRAAQEGASVVSTSLPSDNVAATLEEVRPDGKGRVTHMELDVTDDAAMDRVFREAVDWLGGGVDVLLCSAAIDIWKPTAELTSAEIEEVLRVNLVGTMTANIKAYPYMKGAGGSIINIASDAGILGQPGEAAYAAAKGGIVAFVRTIAQEWGADGVRVNVLLPIVRSGMMQRWYDGMTAEEREGIDAAFATLIHLGGKPADVNAAADVIVFLASDLARFVTGQMVGANGGASMPR